MREGRSVLRRLAAVPLLGYAVLQIIADSDIAVPGSQKEEIDDWRTASAAAAGWLRLTRKAYP